MKANLKGMLRSGMAVLLVLCMVVGFVPAAVFANAGADNDINYVSIGDSMANGYCFTDYHQDSDDLNVYDFITGKGMYGKDAYPMQFEAYLTGLGYDVNHTKLAPSALLAEDLLFLLDGRDEAQDGWGGFRDYVGDAYKHQDDLLKAHFQTAITEADIITLGIGNASFGAYMLDRVTSALGVFGASLDPDELVDFEQAIEVLELSAEDYALVMKMYEMFEAKLVSAVSEDIAAQYNLEQVVDVVSYTAASFVANYKLVMEKILEMNPDVEIVLVGLLNTTYGMNITDDNGEVLLAVGDMMDKAFGMLNTYIAGLPAVLQATGVAKDAKIYYAEQPEPKFICQVFDDLMENGWGEIQDGRLSGATVRSRNITAFNDSLGAMIGWAVNGAPLAKITIEDVQAYEALDWDALAEAAGSYWNPWGAFAFAGYDTGSRDYIDVILSVAIYLAIEEAVANSTNTMDIQLSGLMKIAGDLSSVFTGLGTPPTNAPEATRVWLLNGLSTEEVQGMCKIYGLFKVGNGMSVHPTPEGHDEIAKSVIAAYEGKNTVQDEMDQLIKDIAKDIWNQWVNAGYVGDVEKTINKLIAHVEARYGTYEEMLLKLNTEMEELVATKDALEAELATLKAQLAAKKAELEEVLAKQEIGSVTAPDINIEIDPDLGNNTQTTVPGNDCAVEGETVKEELEAAIADLEHAIAVLEALITDISADIADMAKVAAEIVEAVKELGKTLGEIVAAGKDLMEAMAAVKDVMTNESAFATAEQFKVAYEAAKASAMAALDALKVASGIADELMVDAEYMLDVIIADGEALYNKIKADLPKVIENAPMEVKIALAAALMVAEEKGWDKEWAEDQIRQELDKIKAEYQPEIDQAKKDLADLKAKIETEIETKYEAVKAELTAEANAKIAVLEAKKAALEAEINELKAQLAAAEEAAKATIQAQIDRLTGDLAMVDADIAHAAAHLEAALKIAHDEIVAEVNAIYAEAVAKLEKLIADLNAQLEAAIGKSLEELIALGLDGLKELKDQLIALGKDALAKLVDKLVELYEQMLYKATHGEVLAGVDMKYVALGDGSNDFAAALAELLKGKAPANLEFVNAAKPGATAADVAANLPADVADANVITLGFSQTEIIGKALSAFLNGETIDWAELMGEEAVPYVEKALAYVYEEIDARVADEQTAAMVKAIAEAYAYGAADYAINLPILIKNIREVNKTAEIVIVGMHNPLTEVAIDLPIYGKIDLSAYADVFNYLVDAVYGYGVALSVIARDVTYVDAREVEIEKNTLGLTEVDALLKGDISALYPSAKGDAYIAEQINSALTVKMLGDANDDGVVDSYDATLIARYDVGLIGANDLNLAVCDVNGDGVVDSYDATLVARYDVGLLAA